MQDQTIDEILGDLKPELNLTEKQLTKASAYIHNIKPGEIIHAGSLNKYAGLDSLIKTFKILEAMTDSGILTSLLEEYCGHCHTSQEKYIKTIFDFPKEGVVCKNCGEKLNFESDLLVVYTKNA